MNFSTGLLDLLTKLENSLKCPICNKKCKDPVRIKTCGHYFCVVCLKSSKNEHNCPKCKEFYELKHLDKENIAKETQDQLLELREILENVCKNKTAAVTDQNKTRPSKAKPGQSTDVAVLKSSDNILLIRDEKYHVNFINTQSKKNAKGETPLHLACKKRKFDDVKKLVEQKVDINVKDYAGWAPLHEAVQSQSLEIVEYLLQKGCLVNIPGVEYVTPLHQAASLENIGMVKLILKYGGNKNMVDYTGLKPADSTKCMKIKKLLESHTQVILDNKIFEVYLTNIISLYCHTIDEQQKKKLEECKNINVVDKMDVKKKLTHFVIKETHKLSFKILQAMLEGLQFLTQNSIDDYVAGNYFINIPNYTFLINNAELNEGIKKAMISAILKLPKLFLGINFHIEHHTTPVDIYNLKVDKEYLTKLINAGGGNVLHRPPATRTCESEYVHPYFAPEHSGTYRCCNFIIYDEKHSPELLYNMDELQHKSSRWLIDCIVNYKILD